MIGSHPLTTTPSMMLVVRNGLPHTSRLSFVCFLLRRLLFLLLFGLGLLLFVLPLRRSAEMNKWTMLTYL